MRTDLSCSIFALVGVSLLCPLVMAQDFEAALDSKASSSTLDASGVIDSSGFLIGNFDADTNPDGTQTRPGLFGGSGNQPIDTITTLNTETALDTMPAGSLSINVDAAGGSAQIEGLVVDLLNGQAGVTALSVTIGFETFRTFNPGFLYPGGIPITLPLGDVAQISQAVLSQTGPGIAALSPTGMPDTYEISGVIPAALDLIIVLSFPGGTPIETPLEQLPLLLPVAGLLELQGDDQLLLELGADPDPISVQVPIEGVELPQIPFELPTLGEETAGVLFTLTPESIMLDAVLGLSINATGTRLSCAADLTGDGELNFFDVSAFLSAFSAQDPIADFTGDGEFNFFDVSQFLSAFAAGCP